MFYDEFNHILILIGKKKGLRMYIFFSALKADAVERKEATFKMRLQVSSNVKQGYVL